jgi:hypothetical protein
VTLLSVKGDEWIIIYNKLEMVEGKNTHGQLHSTHPEVLYETTTLVTTASPDLTLTLSDISQTHYCHANMFGNL